MYVCVRVCVCVCMCVCVRARVVAFSILCVRSSMSVEAVVEKAKAAKEGGSTRFCMGAAWRDGGGRWAFKQVMLPWSPRLGESHLDELAPTPLLAGCSNGQGSSRLGIYFHRTSAPTTRIRASDPNPPHRRTWRCA